MKKQAFRKGDIVRVVDDYDGHCKEEPDIFFAVVLGSYADEFGDGDYDESEHAKSQWQILLADGDEQAWFDTDQLTLIKRGGRETINAIRRELLKEKKERRKKKESEHEKVHQ